MTIWDRFNTDRRAGIDPRKKLVTFEERNGCWLCLSHAPRSRFGYPSTKIRGEKISLSRLAYILSTGETIPAGLMARHTCDNSYCINPAHIILGTAHDNAMDAVDRGRNPRGETHGRSKLSDGDVLVMRRLRIEGATYEAIGERFGISTGHTWHVVNRRVWTHVT